MHLSTTAKNSNIKLKLRQIVHNGYCVTNCKHNSNYSLTECDVLLRALEVSK